MRNGILPRLLRNCARSAGVVVGLIRSVGAALAIAAAATACTTPDRTTELAALKPQLCAHPYRCNAIGSDPDPSTLVIVTASGGGSRAAALLLGTLQGLDAFPMSSTTTLLDQVDIVSSVSGGSLTSAAFALDGRAGLERVERGLKEMGLSEIVLRYLDPTHFVGSWLPARAQIDVLIDILSQEKFFGRRTFADVQSRPFLVLNAADMGSGAVFSFTQPTFDLICSDLSRFAVADAVAGSAAYPFGFGALTLRNHVYPDCPAHRAGEQLELHPSKDGLSFLSAFRWPPEDLGGNRLLEPYSFTEAEAFRRRDLQESYFLAPGASCSVSGPEPNKPQCKEWIHLLDGGIADNLGISSVFRMITDPFAQPSFLADIAAGRITRIRVILVNARGEQDRALEASSDSPGWISQLIAVTGSSIDATSALLQSRLEASFREGLLAALSGTFDESILYDRLVEAGELVRDDPRNLDLVKSRFDSVQVSVVPVDFDFMPIDCSAEARRDCEGTPAGNAEDEAALRRLKRYVKSLATTWWLTEQEIDMTRDAAKCLLRKFGGLLPPTDDPSLRTRRGAPECNLLALAQRVPADFQ